MSSFWNRTIFGALYIIVLVFCIVNNVYTFGILFLVLNLFTVNEFCNLINLTGNKLNKAIILPLSAILFIFSFLSAFIFSSNKLILSTIPFFFIPFIIEIFSNQNQKRFSVSSYEITALVYVAVPFSLLNFLSVYQGKYTYQLLLPIFILIWANDTFAYLTGITIGRTKFFEKISPKKTWEGTIGGIIFSMTFGYFLNGYFPILSGMQWIIVAITVSCFGIIGDLVESMLKRNLSVKDSGFFLPGHGGFLDRFDSLIFAVPFVFIVISWLIL
jgi:phosphatidate cytidylyltransferase